MVVIYNKMLQVKDHLVPQEIEISQNGRLRARLTVTSFAAAPTLKESDFIALPDGKGQSAPIVSLAPDIIKGTIVNKVQPIFPESAKREHVSGTVFLSALIGKDGTIQNLDVISAPSADFATSATKAVSQWTYTPYLLNGVPCDVDTVIRVNYSFGGIGFGF